MSGPDNPENKWGGEGQSDPTRIIPNPLPPTGQPGQPGFTPSPWSQSPPTQGQPNIPPPPPPQQGAWSQQPPHTPAWGMPAQPPQGQPPQPSWGQPPQPQQQSWGPPPSANQPWQQAGQPGQPEYGQFPQSTGSGKSKLPLILGLGAVVLLLVIAGVLAALFLRPSVLDQGAVQDGVTDILTNSYGIQGVSDVSCPSDQKVESGASFTCNVSVDGEPRTVTIRIIDDEGTYEVSKPQ